ncbi:MAG: leucyl aminopeptidase [Armatimonadetes bacterium]|nr:leucyl aminopeptidase [Armatimonadota bacterium]
MWPQGHRRESLTANLVLGVGSVPLLESQSDVLILPGWENEEPQGGLASADQELGGWLGEVGWRGEFRGEANQVVLVNTLGHLASSRVALLGLGKRAEFCHNRWRNAVATACRVLGRHGLRTAALDLADVPLDRAIAAEVAAEGAELSCYRVGLYRTSGRRDDALHQLQVVGAGEAALRRGQVLGAAKNWARDLTNEPGNVLTAPELARRAAEMAGAVGVACQVLEQPDLERLEMGAILTVAQGSHTPPRLIVLRHEPEGAPAAPVLALVGKAVTFDTGGISLKPAAEMGRMKGDMAGGAAVLGAMRAIAELSVPVRVLALVPAVNNMPGGSAWMPGDVIRAMSGKTIETISTDAEGRMLLADAVHYARSLGASHVVDIATLTGACVVALGHVASGLFGTDAALVEAIRRCGEAAGEPHWPMPLLPEYRELIRSDIADLKNSGGRTAGAITGAWFIREFAGETPWAHLDIAGSSQLEKARAWAPAGPTGTGVGTFVRLAEELAAAAAGAAG